MHSSVCVSWADLEASLARRRPQVSLRGPAPEGAATKYVAAGAAEVVDAVWRVHDGSTGLVDDYYRLLSLAESLQAHSLRLADIAHDDLGGCGVAMDGAKGEVFMEGWIPIAGDRDWDHLVCVDLDPDADGQRGQVIEVHHIEGVHGRLALDLDGWLKQLAESLEQAAVARERVEGRAARERHEQRSALEATFAELREQGVDLGDPTDEDLELDPSFAIGQGGEWDAHTQAIRRFLTITPGVHGLGWGDFDSTAELVLGPARRWQLPFDVDEALVPTIDVLRAEGAPKEQVLRTIVAEIDAALGRAGDERRLHRLVGKGAPFHQRFVLLSSEARDAVARSGLVAFADDANAPQPGSPLSRWFRAFSKKKS